MFHSMMYGTRMMGPFVRMRFYGAYSWMMGLVCLVILVALVLSIVAIVRTSKKRVHRDSTAQTILAERFARGEISREEFEQMKKDLSH
jgi:putative membrane protein